MLVYLTNGRVAWQIPNDNNIADRYRLGIYLTPPKWGVSVGRMNCREWQPRPYGPLVRIRERVTNG